MVTVNITTTNRARNKKINDYRGDFNEFLCSQFFEQNNYLVLKLVLKRKCVDEQYKHDVNLEVCTDLGVVGQKDLCKFLVDNVAGLPDFYCRNKSTNEIVFVECKAEGWNLTPIQQSVCERLVDQGQTVLQFITTVQFIERDNQSADAQKRLQNPKVTDVKYGTTEIRTFGSSNLPNLAKMQLTIDSFE